MAAKKGRTKQSTAYSSARLIQRGYDACIESAYITFNVGIPDFLRITDEAYSQQGLMEGQRDVVHTASAKRIRARMGADLIKGAAIPPIVLGTTAATPKERKRVRWNAQDLQSLLGRIAPRSISIIDGMQRTTVITDNSEKLADRSVRVELWLAPSTDKLIYRMLILNTGQIPWTVRRQLEVVYRSFIEELQSSNIPGLSLHKVDDAHRRTQPGEFQAHDAIEMYLAYNLRKPHVDKESALADQFSRLDLIESVSAPAGMKSFLDALRLLVALDGQFSRAPAQQAQSAPSAIPTGRHIFDKTSACAGFMAAYALFVRGRIGMDRDTDGQRIQRDKAKASVDAVVRSLARVSETQVGEFLALETLREVLDKRGGQLSIGEKEREMFMSAFRILFEEGALLPSMEPCWRSQ